MAGRRSGKGRKSAGGSSELQETLILTAFQKALLNESDSRIKVKIDGKETELTKNELAVRKLVQMAMNGSTHAMSNLLRELNRAQEIRQVKIDEQLEWGEKFKAMQQARLEALQKAGKSTDSVLPHPDDIVLDPKKGCRFIGPSNETELAAVMERVAFMETCMMQDELESRMGIHESEHMSGAFFLMELFNSSLPVRFRRDTVAIFMASWKYERLTKRELLKMCREAWRKRLGREVPRGFTLPSMPFLAEAYKFFFAQAKFIKDETIAGRNPATNEYALMIQRKVREIRDEFLHMPAADYRVEERSYD